MSFFSVLENRFVSYADDSILIDVVSSHIFTAEKSLNHDFISDLVVWPLGDEIECE